MKTIKHLLCFCQSKSVLVVLQWSGYQMKKHKCILSLIISGVVCLILHLLLSRLWNITPYRHIGQLLIMIISTTNCFVGALLGEYKKTHPEANEKINHNPYNASLYYQKIWKKSYIQWSIAIWLLILILLGPAYLYIWSHKINDYDILMSIFIVEFFLPILVVFILELYRAVCFCITTDQICS